MDKDELLKMLEQVKSGELSPKKARRKLLRLFRVSASTVIKELHEALTNLLQAADDEGWINDETGEDWEEQSQARKALANVPKKYLR